MKKLLVTIFTIINGLYAYSQGTIKIKGCIRDMPYAKVYLGALYAGKMTYIDSTLASNGCFDFYIDATRPTGLYNIVMNRQSNSFMRVIINKEPIEFNSVFSSLLDSMNFTAGEENTFYYNYTKLAQKAMEKKDLLKKLLLLYPSSSAFSKTLQTEMKQADVMAADYAADLIAKHPNSFAAAYIKSQQPVALPAGSNEPSYLRQHYLDNVDFSNGSLLNSDIFTVSILNYISFVESNKNTYREQVLAYAEALDNIMARTASRQELYDYYLGQLRERYRYGNYDILGAYLTAYYQDVKPGAPKVFPGNAAERLSKLGTITVGKKAPEISMPTYDGKQTSLADIQADYTLLVFWSTDCSHCTEMLPVLKQVYDKRKGPSLEVLAVSLDTQRDIWETFIKKGNYSWMNYSDMKGFNSDIAKAYDIKGTPTFLLLNRDKIVIHKPATIEELVNRLKSLNII
jgi:peroxiredoxin